MRCRDHERQRGAALLAILALWTSGAGAASPVALRSGGSWRPAGEVAARDINGAALLTGVVRDASIGPATVTGAYRAVESEKGATVERLTISGLVGRDLQRDGIRLRTANDVTIRDFDLQMRSQPQSGKNLPEGIAIYAGRNIAISRGRVRRFRMERGKGYTNGDGIATEGDTQGSITDVVSSDNSDGGFDLKGSWTLDRLRAERNGRDYRFWGTVTAGALVADGWTSAAVWIGKGATVRIATLEARNDGTAPLLILAGNTTVEIGRCVLTRPAGAPLSKSEGSGNSVKLGPGCH